MEVKPEGGRIPLPGPDRVKARNQILQMKYYFNLPQAKRNPILLSLTVKMTSYIDVAALLHNANC